MGGNSIAGNKKETDGKGRGKERQDREDGEDEEAREDKEVGEVGEEAELTHAVTSTLTPITAPQHTYTHLNPQNIPTTRQAATSPLKTQRAKRQTQ